MTNENNNTQVPSNSNSTTTTTSSSTKRVSSLEVEEGGGGSGRERSYSYEMEEEEFDEAIGLLGTNSGGGRGRSRSYEEYHDDYNSSLQGRMNSRTAWIWWGITIFFVLSLSALVRDVEEQETAGGGMTSSSYSSSSLSNSNNHQHTKNLNIQCKNDDDDLEEEEEQQQQVLVDDWNDLKTLKYEPWTKTYDQVKAKIIDWKAKQYLPYIHDGDSILEIGCSGNGMNMYITLEILKKNGKLSTLQVYDNCPTKKATIATSSLLKNHPEVLPKQQQVMTNTICTGNPLDMSNYVPSNIFDFVFTGTVDLSWVMNNNHDGVYSELVENKNEKEDILCSENMIKVEELQDLTNDIYYKWLQEMVRVTRPGGRIVIENVSPPLCSTTTTTTKRSNNNDSRSSTNGGVSQSWWYETIQSNEFSDSIDRDSLVFGNSQIFKDDYHVAMVKKSEL